MAQTTSKEPHHQPICFPWGIFEACGVPESPEANDASFTIAVSQLSADVSTCLSMFEKLARFADEKHDGQHIPPVIAITSVGAKTTVWFAYCDIVDDKIRDHVRALIYTRKKKLTNQ
jgi:UDP-N-acetylmuramyl pentapeptide synthase